MFENLRKIKESKMYGVIKAISTSAILALLLSLVFFTYDVYKDSAEESRSNEHFEKTVQQLDRIRESLSTRFLGRFPIYLTEINNVFAQLQPEDSVIIFEDVLYYGIKSRPAEFRKFNQMLINHARKYDKKVIVAYYNNHPQEEDEPYIFSVFHKMIIENRVDAAYIPKMRAEKNAAFKGLDKDPEEIIRKDSLITEKYFVMTRKKNQEKAAKDVQMYLQPIAPNNAENDTSLTRMYHEIDSIKEHYLGKGKKLDDIRFVDYENMYSAMTDCIVRCYQANGIELISLNEYLTMSCWLLKPSDENRPTEAILAFPSKYSSEEIGFYSQDASFSDYISMMLNGVRDSIE